MTNEELLRALQPVQEFFTAAEVNVNTVLAAHLRAVGVAVQRVPWEVAKAALHRGATFEDAAREAAATDGLASSRGVSQSRVSSPPRELDSGEPCLEWFPKQFGPGDIDGVGAKKLLGTPSMANAAVLVRETGQNSWDARGESHEIEFVLNLRRLEPAAIEELRERVFTGECTRTGLKELLDQDEVWVLEVSDRGTVGLGGPVRNDLAVPPGQATNFIDLVLNIGAPRDVHLGGGTYGFGKTIAYSVSSVGTTLIWSRCEASGGLEHRLIGSAISDGFDQDGRRYTGRHWWGKVVGTGDRVEPLTGAAAATLAERLFAKRFHEAETGTSILILDPVLSGEGAEEDIDQLVEAVTWHLWPKMLAEQGGRARMKIRVQLNGQDVDLPAIEQHPMLSGHAACLYAVRAVQDGRDAGENPVGLPVSVKEIWCHLPHRLLGHLAMTRYPVPRGMAQADGDGIQAPSRHVTLMRHGAELVVKYLERAPLEVDGFQWAGVFKPVDAVDDSYAMAEPPAHDDWIPNSIADKAAARDVRVGLRRVQEAIAEFLSPGASPSSRTAPASSAAVVGDRLADLVAGLDGPAPMRLRPSKASGGKRAARPRVEIVGADTRSADVPGWIHTVVGLRLGDAGSRGATVEVRLRVGVDGGSEEGAEVIKPLGWRGRERVGDRETDGVSKHLTGGELFHYEFEARSDIAVDVDAVVVEA